MNRLFCTFVLLALLPFLLPLHPWGNKDDESKLYRNRNGKIKVQISEVPGKNAKLPEVEVTGTVRLVGSGLHTQFVITGSDAEWHVETEEQHKLEPFQQSPVTVKAKTYTIEMTFPTGIKLVELYLRDLTVRPAAQKTAR